MSAEAGLMQAILEQPEDDTPRLVYADWLDERGGPGDADRAEFIRVGIEYAGLEEGDERRPGLQRRLERLRLKYSREWLKELPAWARSRAVFRRGFVAQVSATPARLLQEGDALFRAAPVEAVVVVNRPAGLGGLEALLGWAGLARLRGLDLAPRAVTSAGARLLARSPHLGRLRDLRLKGNPLGAEGARALTAAPWFRGLTRLGLADTRIGGEGVTALLDAPGVAGLQILDLSSNRLDTADAEALAAARLGGLHTLSLGRNEMRGGGAVRLVGSPALAGLRALLLWSNGVDAGAAAELAALPGLARLAQLDLGGNPIGARGAQALAASPHTANLRALFLWVTRLGDAGAEALAASPFLANLTELNLLASGIQDAGALALARSPHLGGVAALCLRENKLTARAQRVLRERFGEGLDL